MLRFNSNCATYMLCSFGQVTEQLRSLFPRVSNGDGNSTYFIDTVHTSVFHRVLGALNLNCSEQCLVLGTFLLVFSSPENSESRRGPPSTEDSSSPASPAPDTHCAPGCRTDDSALRHCAMLSLPRTSNFRSLLSLVLRSKTRRSSGILGCGRP